MPPKIDFAYIFHPSKCFEFLPSDMPPPRQCAAMPMVKGQVISKPTISLQRVDMPVNVTINAPANMAVNAPENAPVNVAVNSSENAPVNVAVNAPENAPVGFRKKNRPPLRPTKGIQLPYSILYVESQ